MRYIGGYKIPGNSLRSPCTSLWHVEGSRIQGWVRSGSAEFLLKCKSSYGRHFMIASSVECNWKKWKWFGSVNWDMWLVGNNWSFTLSLPYSILPLDFSLSGRSLLAVWRHCLLRWSILNVFCTLAPMNMILAGIVAVLTSPPSILFVFAPNKIKLLQFE
jgi:hypothetical protein